MNTLYQTLTNQLQRHLSEWGGIQFWLALMEISHPHAYVKPGVISYQVTKPVKASSPPLT